MAMENHIVGDFWTETLIPGEEKKGVGQNYPTGKKMKIWFLFITYSKAYHDY